MRRLYKATLANPNNVYLVAYVVYALDPEDARNKVTAYYNSLLRSDDETLGSVDILEMEQATVIVDVHG